MKAHWVLRYRHRAYQQTHLSLLLLTPGSINRHRIISQGPCSSTRHVHKHYLALLFARAIGFVRLLSRSANLTRYQRQTARNRPEFQFTFDSGCRRTFTGRSISGSEVHWSRSLFRAEDVISDFMTRGCYR